MTKSKLPWIYLAVGGVMETVWAVAMKCSEGFTILPYTVVSIAFIIISMIFLSKGMDGGIPVGTAYAVWVGIGAVGAVVAGILLLGDVVNMLQIAFIMMVVAGIVGLQITSKSEKSNV